MNSPPWGSWTIPLLHHLWQSSVFAAGVGLLTLALGRNPARLRYRLWMAASLKFLLPFSLLIAVGAHLPWAAHLDRTQPAMATVVEGVAQPLLQPWSAAPDPNIVTAAEAARHASEDWLPLALLSVWASGTLLLLGRWMANWLRLRATVRRGEPIALADRSRALLVAQNLEPGVFGIVRPMLVLPRGIAERLSTEQLDAIVAHELCHIRRRDNLTAALHMVVEALFWFHPVVWWLRTRLIEERERACDEAVLETTRQPFAYAEGILNVCKFCVEAPLSCVSGVTGSELKQRIARILSGRSVRQLDVHRKLLLALACVAAVAVPVTAGVVRAAQGQTQPAQKNGIAGPWQGTLRTPDGHTLRLVLKLARDEKGALSGTLYSIDQNGPPIPADSVTLAGETLRFVINLLGFTYAGKLSADGNSISGAVRQNGSSFPVVLERTTPETAWAIPAPLRTMPPMAADAKPGVEVATIKPCPPDAPRTAITFRGGEIVIERMSLNDLIEYVYDVHEKQILRGPGWMGTEKWDIEAKPDTPGSPDGAQFRMVLQQLLADRFALHFHQDKREMAAYVLTVSRDGAKLTKNAESSGRPRYVEGPGGLIRMSNATMGDLTELLQGTVLDRPVVDHTGLTGHWDFVLRWLVDETQFGGQLKPPPADDPAASLPPLFTAMQEQLGLKLESQKMDVPVMVIDRVDQPSPN
ncbi:MAG TPA: M56 family metallopeptidase [Acidobacteriaceae bacterium]|jgi:uncharacterized protein (TIGR03435 family)|nr:M56 family metallopeptidase [Acidobacteriaceae bacterium]